MKITNTQTRNPSPPPLTEAERVTMTGDLIGSTIFSQHWVLDTLLKLYKHEEGTVYTAVEEKDNKSPEHTTSSEENEIGGKERSLESCFENDLCQLWDMTANTEVSLFLNEHDVKSVLRDALKRTQSPRLMEICFGILGNLLCVKEIRISYTGAAVEEDEDCGEFRDELLSYLTVSDALSLVELTRLLCTCVSCPSCSSLWIRNLLSSNRIGQMIYLLKNTLNIDLLSHVVKILDIMFDEMSSEEFNENLVTDDLVVGLIEAYDQFHEHGIKSEYFVSLIHLLQLIATGSNQGSELVSRKHEVILQCMEKYFKLLDHYESGLEMPVFDRLTIYASTLSLLVSLSIENGESIVHSLTTNIAFIEHCLSYLRNIVENGHGVTNSVRLTYLTICMEALSPLLKQLFADTSNGEQSALETLKKTIDDLLKSIRQSVLHDSLNELCEAIEIYKKL